MTLLAANPTQETYALNALQHKNRISDVYLRF